MKGATTWWSTDYSRGPCGADTPIRLLQNVAMCDKHCSVRGATSKHKVPRLRRTIGKRIMRLRLMASRWGFRKASFAVQSVPWLGPGGLHDRGDASRTSAASGL